MSDESSRPVAGTETTKVTTVTDAPTVEADAHGATATTATRRRKPIWPLVLAFLVGGALITGLITALLVNIVEKKNESRDTFTKVVNIDEKTFDSAVWGQNFPHQYEGWLNTKNQEQPGDKVPRTPTADDPREFTTPSKLESDPRLVTMWQGYAFAVDYREPRGHAWMLTDQQLTKRMTDPRFKQPGACLNCHVSLPEMLDSINPTDHDAAWATMNKTPYKELNTKDKHPVGCIDCHDPKTMELRVTRPAFIEGIKVYKESQGIKSYDVNKDAKASEMRTYVCAQCHVEYYFKGKEKTLTFPWEKGLTVDDALAYYDEKGFTDFTHKLTDARIVKAQHPDFETYSQGVHAKAGVTCADCHMAYTRDGATKYSDHQVRSPMTNDETINRTCLTCHHTTEKDMRERVETIHSRYDQGRDVAFDAFEALVKDIEKAKKSGVAADRIALAQAYQRKASFFLDYSVSENSEGFHAPQYSMRILNDVTDASRLGQLALQGIKPEKGTKPAIQPPPTTAPTATPAPTPTVDPSASPSPSR